MTFPAGGAILGEAAESLDLCSTIGVNFWRAASPRLVKISRAVCDREQGDKEGESEV